MPTDADSEATPKFRVVEQMGSIVPEESIHRSSTLLVYSSRVRGYDQVMTLLINSGESQKFVKLEAEKRARRATKRLDKMASAKKRPYV